MTFHWSSRTLRRVRSRALAGAIEDGERLARAGQTKAGREPGRRQAAHLAGDDVGSRRRIKGQPAIDRRLDGAGVVGDAFADRPKGLDAGAGKLWTSADAGGLSAQAAGPASTAAKARTIRCFMRNTILWCPGCRTSGS